MRHHPLLIIVLASCAGLSLGASQDSGKPARSSVAASMPASGPASVGSPRIVAYKPQTTSATPTEASRATTRPANSLTVRVTGLRPQGALLVAVFEQPEGFPRRDKATRTVLAPVTNKSADLRIDDLQAGHYAVAIFQDLNEDGVLNRGAFGVPSEPYGFSNNVRGKFGPPSFEAASFRLAESDTRLDVQLH